MLAAIFSFSWATVRTKASSARGSAARAESARAVRKRAKMSAKSGRSLTLLFRQCREILEDFLGVRRRIDVGVPLGDLPVATDEHALAHVEAHAGHHRDSVGLGERAVLVDQEIEGDRVLRAERLMALLVLARDAQDDGAELLELR